MLLSTIPEERVRRKTKQNCTKAPNTRKKPERNSTRSSSLTTSAIANGTSSSISTDDTMNMISTPWSTETWSTCSRRSISWGRGSTSLEPKTTTTYGAPSPELKSSRNSITVTLLSEKPSGSRSRCVQPLQHHSTATFSSWSLETYTSTGLASDAVRVNYPWSPNTSSTDLDSSVYPSTLNLISQKCSRETVGKEKYLSPMNYIVVLDDNPGLDWVIVKQKGILVK